MKTKIGIIFGGRSGEHEISIRSAKTVIEQIDKEKYDVIPIAITRRGHWLNPMESLHRLPESIQEVLLETVRNFPSNAIALVGDTRYKGLTRLETSPKEEKFSPLDVVFPVLHGTYGEDGTLQGLLEMADIPYIGCGVLASACGMDKVVMKTLFRDAELPMCKYVWFLRSEWEDIKTRLSRKPLLNWAFRVLSNLRIWVRRLEFQKQQTKILCEKPSNLAPNTTVK